MPSEGLIACKGSERSLWSFRSYPEVLPTRGYLTAHTSEELCWKLCSKLLGEYTHHIITVIGIQVPCFRSLARAEQCLTWCSSVYVNIVYIIIITRLSTEELPRVRKQERNTQRRDTTMAVIWYISLYQIWLTFCVVCMLLWWFVLFDVLTGVNNVFYINACVCLFSLVFWLIKNISLIMNWLHEVELLIYNPA